MLQISNEDNMELMSRYPDKHFDLAIVDVPYGIGENGSTNKSRSKLAKSKDYKSFAGGDKDSPDINYWNELLRVSKNQIVWGANHFVSKIPFDSSCWIVWDKVNGENDFADCELAWTSFNSAVRQVRFMWHGFMQGGDYNGFMQGNKKLNEQRIHPTQKPVALYKWVLDKYAKIKCDHKHEEHYRHLCTDCRNSNVKILDTHLGSGSIAIACHDYGFDLTACELDKDYYNAAMNRINNHMKQQKLFA